MTDKIIFCNNKQAVRQIFGSAQNLSKFYDAKQENLFLWETMAVRLFIYSAIRLAEILLAHRNYIRIYTLDLFHSIIISKNLKLAISNLSK